MRVRVLPRPEMLLLLLLPWMDRRAVAESHPGRTRAFSPGAMKEEEKGNKF